MQYGRTVRCFNCGFKKPIDDDICPTCHSVSVVTKVELTRTQQAWLLGIAAVLFVGFVVACASDNYLGTNFLETLQDFCTKENSL